MTGTKRLGLTTIDGRLMDGLKFCLKTYELFDQVRGAPDGLAKLRLRPTRTADMNEKKVLEELLPLARYIQARYTVGRRIKARWFSGSQPYDAILLSSGGKVTHGEAPRRVLVEITTTVHPNEHLARRLLHEGGVLFGPKGTYRDNQTGKIISKPRVHTPDEVAADLAGQILERLTSKSSKGYPSGTVLIINCIPNNLILPSEWEDAIERVEKAEAHLAFREVFLLEMVGSYSATLYGNRITDERK